MKHTWPCLLLLLLIAFSACRKSEGTKPGKDTSDTTQNPPVFEQIPSIAGSMLPLFAVKDFEVLIKEIRPGKDTVLKPDAQGAFKINGLADGTYSVSIKIAGHTVMELATIVRSFTTQNLGRLDFTGSQYIPLVTGTGKITGSIRPAGVSTMISATHTGNWQTYTTNVNPDGTFTFENLPAGTYSGSLYNGTRYTPVNNAGFELTISDGQVSNVGEIAFYDNTDPASPNYITYEIDGLKNIRKRFVGAAYGVPYFSLFTYDKGFTQSTNSGSIGQYVETDRLDISLDEVNGTGTYQVKGGAGSTIRFSARDRGFTGLSRTIKIWSVNAAGGTGSVTITSIDPLNRTLNGTFTATLVPENGSAKGNKVITNGSFNNYKY